MVRVEAEDIGMHTHDKQIRSDLELRLKLSSVAVLNTNSAVKFSVQRILNLGRHLQERIFQLSEYREGIIKDSLFKC